MTKTDTLTTDPKKQPKGGPRRQSRQLALQFLYQLDAQKGQNLNQIDPFLVEFCTDMKVRQLARDWIKGTWLNLDQINTMISSASKNWNIDRISNIDRSNLRLAIYQLLDCPDIPPKVVINEAIELAKEFSTPQAPTFVNGVLDTIAKKIIPEMQAKQK